jgi:hypothetical protein
MCCDAWCRPTGCPSRENDSALACLSDIGPDPEPVVVIGDPPPSPEHHEVFGRYAHQIAFTLPHGPHRTLGVVLSRATRDFTAAERDLLELARPFLIQAYSNAVRYTELLTLGEASGAVPGVPERDIGDRLGISHRTVQKHLQRCYRQLGVSNRSRAAAIAWSTIDPAGG